MLSYDVQVLGDDTVPVTAGTLVQGTDFSLDASGATPVSSNAQLQFSMLRGVINQAATSLKMSQQIATGAIAVIDKAFVDIAKAVATAAAPMSLDAKLTWLVANSSQTTQALAAVLASDIGSYTTLFGYIKPAIDANTVGAAAALAAVRNKKILWWTVGILAVVGVGAGGYYYWTRHKAATAYAY